LSFFSSFFSLCFPPFSVLLNNDNVTKKKGGYGCLPGEFRRRQQANFFLNRTGGPLPAAATQTKGWGALPLNV
jgi:hypothetical protein